MAHGVVLSHSQQQPTCDVIDCSSQQLGQRQQEELASTIHLDKY